jgi:hypothetical protein
MERWDFWNSETRWQLTDEEIAESWWQEKIDDIFEDGLLEQCSGENEK